MQKLRGRRKRRSTCKDPGRIRVCFFETSSSFIFFSPACSPSPLKDPTEGSDDTVPIDCPGSGLRRSGLERDPVRVGSFKGSCGGWIHRWCDPRVFSYDSCRTDGRGRVAQGTQQIGAEKLRREGASRGRQGDARTRWEEIFSTVVLLSPRSGEEARNAQARTDRWKYDLDRTTATIPSVETIMVKRIAKEAFA